MERHNTLSEFTRAATTVSLALLVMACSVPGAQVNSAAPTPPSLAPGSIAVDPSSGSGDLPAPSPYIRTAWEQELSNLAEDGTRSVESALRLFAMAFGPLPDVAVASDDPGEIMSGSVAARAIRAHWDDLSPAQRTAVEQYLAIPPDVEPYAVPATSANAQPAPGPVALGPARGDSPISGAIAATDPFIESTLEQIKVLRQHLADRWGGFPNEVFTYFRLDQSGSYTYYDVDVTPGKPQAFACRLFVTASGKDAGPAKLYVSLAHEIFYCGAAAKLQSKEAVDLVPGWVLEGGAHYFAMWATSGLFENAWNEYFSNSSSPLFQREYDAIGFWSHIEYSLGHVFEAIAAALPEASSEERFVRAGGLAAPFINTWASGLYRDEAGNAGHDWNTAGPGLPLLARAQREHVTIANNEVVVFDQGAYGNHLAFITTTADLLRFELIGRPRMTDEQSVDTTALASAVYCTRMGGCPPCPSNPAQNYPPLSQRVVLALGGGTDGASGTVSGEPLEPCKSPEVCPDGAQTLGGGSDAVALVGGVTVAQATPCPTPKPTEDEFCKRYRAMVDWIAGHSGSDFELTQPWAAEIARRSRDMKPYAPQHLVDDVNTYIAVYALYASVPEPANVPIVGPDAVNLGNAFMAMNEYCGITL